MTQIRLTTSLPDSFSKVLELDVAIFEWARISRKIYVPSEEQQGLQKSLQEILNGNVQPLQPVFDGTQRNYHFFYISKTNSASQIPFYAGIPNSVRSLSAKLYDPSNEENTALFEQIRIGFLIGMANYIDTLPLSRQ